MKDKLKVVVESFSQNLEIMIENSYTIKQIAEIFIMNGEFDDEQVSAENLTSYQLPRGNRLDLDQTVGEICSQQGLNQLRIRLVDEREGNQSNSAQNITGLMYSQPLFRDSLTDKQLEKPSARQQSEQRPSEKTRPIGNASRLQTKPIDSLLKINEYIQKFREQFSLVSPDIDTDDIMNADRNVNRILRIVENLFLDYKRNQKQAKVEKDSLRQMCQSLAKQQTEKQGLKQQVAELRQQVAELKQQVAESTQKVLELEQSMQILQSKLCLKDNEISSLSEQLSIHQKSSEKTEQVSILNLLKTPNSIMASTEVSFRLEKEKYQKIENSEAIMILHGSKIQRRHVLHFLNNLSDKSNLLVTITTISQQIRFYASEIRTHQSGVGRNLNSYNGIKWLDSELKPLEMSRNAIKLSPYVLSFDHDRYQLKEDSINGAYLYDKLGPPQVKKTVTGFEVYQVSF